VTNREDQSLQSASVEFPVDKALPGLATMLDIEQVAGILASGDYTSALHLKKCRITHIRYKPGTNCLIAFSAESGDKNNVLFYAKCYLGSDFQSALEKAGQKQWITSEGVPPFIVLPVFNTIIYFFPNDCQLTGLPSVFDYRKLRRLIYKYVPTATRPTLRLSYKRLKTSIARYKPERRAVVRVEAPVTDMVTGKKETLALYVRSYSDDQGQGIYDRMLSLYDFAHGLTDIVVARPLVWLADKKLLFVESLPGKPLLESLNEGEEHSSISVAAHALSALHRCQGKLELRRHVNNLLLDADSTARSLFAVAPDMQKDIETTLESLRLNKPEWDETQECFVHGDFYHGQVIINNGKAAIIDFDRSYRGDSLADVGNFCAHLRLARIQGRQPNSKTMEAVFLKAYEDHAATQIDKKTLDFWTAYGLFLLSVAPYRSLRSGWKEFTSEVLIECQKSLP